MVLPQCRGLDVKHSTCAEADESAVQTDLQIASPSFQRNIGETQTRERALSLNVRKHVRWRSAITPQIARVSREVFLCGARVWAHILQDLNLSTSRTAFGLESYGHSLRKPAYVQAVE